MQLADLLFLLLVLVTLVTMVRFVWRLVRKGPAGAVRTLRVWIALSVCYLAALLVVSLIQPGKTIALGEPECFDDWCIAVTAVDSSAANDSPASATITVTLRVSNRGRGRAQAEPDAYVALIDREGRRLEMSQASRGGPSIGDVVAAGQSITVQTTFDLPPNFAPSGLIKAQRFNFPGIILIGAPSSVLHRPTVHALVADQASP